MVSQKNHWSWTTMRLRLSLLLRRRCVSHGLDNVLRVWHGFETVVHPTSFQEQSSGQGIWPLSGPPMRALAHSSSPLPWGCWKPRALPTGAPRWMSPRETTCSTAMLFVAHDLCWLRCSYKPNSTSGSALYTTLNISVLGISSNLWEIPWRVYIHPTP